MLNTSNWPEKTLDVIRDLHLDPRNVRLEIDPTVEADILEDLFSNENALGLVDAICKVGYLTHDVPVVIDRDGKWIMVEGNRRLAALKAIQNPQLVPTYRARISELSKTLDDRSALKKIRVMVAPTQTAADELVAAIHTSNLRRRWGPTRQAAFFQAQVDSRRSLKTLIARYPTIDVRKFVLRAQLVNAFRSADLKDPALRDFLDTKQWTKGLSALARIIESRDFLSLTGFEMDKKGKLTKSISDAKFNKVAAIVVAGIQSGDLTTRSLNTVRSPRFMLLMDEIREVIKPRRATTRTGGAANAGNATTGGASQTGSSSGQQTGSSGSSGQRTRSGRKRRSLDVSHIVLPQSYPVATEQCIKELSAIEVQKFPNATFLLMRAVLEKTIKAFADAKEADIRGVGNDNGRVQLGHALKWLLQFVQAEGPSNLIQPIQRVRDGKLIYMASADSLNAVNHNQNFAVDPDEAIAMWDAIDPIMRFVIKL